MNILTTEIHKYKYSRTSMYSSKLNLKRQIMIKLPKAKSSNKKE
jgi:hypothetical protein